MLVWLNKPICILEYSTTRKNDTHNSDRVSNVIAISKLVSTLMVACLNPDSMWTRSR